MNHSRWHTGYYRMILLISLLCFFGWFHLIQPGSGITDNSSSNLSGFSTASGHQFSYRPIRIYCQPQDAAARLARIRYSIKKPGSKTDPNERFIREKIQVNADRAPKTALPLFPREFLNYIPFVKSLLDQYSFPFISHWTGNNFRVRPPPVF